jgi:hypothetical protein
MGVLALIGAFTAAAGEMVVPPIWAVTTEWSVVCPLVSPSPLVVLAEVPPPFWSAEPPEQSLAMQTGVLALIGALAETAGLTVVSSAWTVPIEAWVDWSPVWL